MGHLLQQKIITIFVIYIDLEVHNNITSWIAIVRSLARDGWHHCHLMSVCCSMMLLWFFSSFHIGWHHVQNGRRVFLDPEPPGIIIQSHTASEIEIALTIFATMVCVFDMAMYSSIPRAFWYTGLVLPYVKFVSSYAIQQWMITGKILN